MPASTHPRQPVTVVSAEETIYFSRPDGGGQLRQWLRVTLSSRDDSEMRAVATVSAGGEDVITNLAVLPGTHVYRCYGPVLWPRWPPADAPLTVDVGHAVVRARVAVGRHRPWSLYLLGDDCVDYTWAYEDLERQIADSVATTRAEIAACRETDGACAAEQNRHNLIHSVELGYFLEQATEEEERELAELVGQERISLSVYHDMMLTANVSLPEAIRQFYPAVRFARKWGLSLRCANHQETPTISWSQASLLAGSGVRYLVQSNLAYGTPWNDRLQEPPVFLWEGPDGARVLVRRRNTDYSEGAFALGGADAVAAGVAGRIAEYEAWGDAYPFSAIGLVGCYSDLSPATASYAVAKAAAVAGYNNGEWEYPRLVNSSHDLFWNEIEAQICQRGLRLPVYRGDYGASWEVWPISLAECFAGWRRAQERATQADSLAALTAWANPEAWSRLAPRLEEGWRNLLLLSDHAWNGSSDGSRRLNAGLRRQWQVSANAAFDAVIAAALGPANATTTDKLTVVNTLGWQRGGLVRIAAEGLPPGPLQAVAESDGQAVPVGECEDVSGRRLEFVAHGVQALAARTYLLRPTVSPTLPLSDGERAIENDYYRVEVGGDGGAILSIWDKRRSCELVDRAGGGLNRANYCAGRYEGPLPLVWDVAREVGPVSATLNVRARADGIEIDTRIGLSQGLDHVAIENRVFKAPREHPELLSFAFPFDVPGSRYRVEGPGVVYAPGDVDRGGEQRPGSGQGVHAVRHCVDVYNQRGGVYLAQLDSGIIRFGRVGVDDAPREPGDAATIYSLVLGSAHNYREVFHDQGGATEFLFRYALRSHGGGSDPAAMLRFGAEAATGLLSIAGDSAAATWPLLRVLPTELLLVELKIADEGIERGLLARLWNPGECDVTGRIVLDGARGLAGVWRTDLVERDQERLAVVDGSAEVCVPARGYASVRLLPADGDTHA